MSVLGGWFAANRHRRNRDGGPNDSDSTVGVWLVWLTVIALGGTVMFLAFLASPRATPSELIATEQIEVEIAGVNPPKHVYLDLKDLRTGEVYQRCYVSKHYNGWRDKLVVGRRIVVTRETWKAGDQTYYRWPGLREILDRP